MPSFLLIFLDETNAPAVSPERRAEVMGGMGRFAGEQAARGVLQGGSPLHPVAEGARVRRNDDRTDVTDGPFAETKEVIGGYFVVECANLEEAVALAGECPHVEIGPVEVRQVMEMGGPPR